MVAHLPNAEDVHIEQAKIVSYLLSLEHDEGKSKASFFLNHGFSVAEWEKLANALRQHALLSVTSIDKTVHGTKYVIEGDLLMPDGRTGFVRSVWIIDVGGETPRLVTAYPL